MQGIIPRYTPKLDCTTRRKLAQFPPNQNIIMRGQSRVLQKSATHISAVAMVQRHRYPPISGPSVERMTGVSPLTLIDPKAYPLSKILLG